MCSVFNRNVKCEVALNSAEREAMFDLLKPRDVRVIVGRRPHGIYLEGTRGEIQTVERFIQLFIDEGHDHRHWPDPDKSRDPWDMEMVQRTYRLSKSKARTLAHALSFTDLYVIRPSRRELVIIARDEEHQTVEGMVGILGGSCTEHWYDDERVATGSSF